MRLRPAQGGGLCGEEERRGEQFVGGGAEGGVEAQAGLQEGLGVRRHLGWDVGSCAAVPAPPGTFNFSLKSGPPSTKRTFCWQVADPKTAEGPLLKVQRHATKVMGPGFREKKNCTAKPENKPNLFFF